MPVTMNLFQTVFTDFNPSKFVVYTSLFLFVLLFALRLDGFITWSFWFVFLPLWIWKGVVVLSALVGLLVWALYRDDSPSVDADPDHNFQAPPGLGGTAHSHAYTATAAHFKAMLMSVATQMLLLIFEVLACEKLDEGRSYRWIFVFSPLIFISILSVFICVWSIKNDRSLEGGSHRMAVPGSQPLPSFSIQMEIICSVNILQFIFIALRLDNFLDWRWSVVFIPLWIVMFLALIVVLYSVILACLYLRSPDLFNYHRRGNINAALAHFFFIVPLLVFEIMLTKKLDYQAIGTPPYAKSGDTHPNAPYLYISVAFPLLVSLLTLLFTSVGIRGGNPWWCGIRKDFCSFLVLNLCPLLQEYGNISYQVHLDDEISDELDSSVSTVQGTLSNSSSYESGRPSLQPSDSFPSGLSSSFSSRFFKPKKKNISPSGGVKTSSTVPVLFIDVPD